MVRRVHGCLPIRTVLSDPTTLVRELHDRGFRGIGPDFVPVGDPIVVSKDDPRYTRFVFSCTELPAEFPTTDFTFYDEEEFVLKVHGCGSWHPVLFMLMVENRMLNLGDPRDAKTYLAFHGFRGVEILDRDEESYVFRCVERPPLLPVQVAVRVSNRRAARPEVRRSFTHVIHGFHGLNPETCTPAMAFDRARELLLPHGSLLLCAEAIGPHEIHVVDENAIAYLRTADPSRFIVKYSRPLG